MTITITPGDLRHVVQLQSPPASQDTSGQGVMTWTTTASPFAKIEPSAGRSQLAGEAQASTETHVVTIRYRPGVTARMRVLYGTRVFEIDSVIDLDERHFWLELHCTEGLTQG